MKYLILSLMLFLGHSCWADIASEPWPQKLQDFPKSQVLVIQDFRISVKSSADQEGAGNGGAACDILIQNNKTGAKRIINDQNIGLAVLHFYSGWPQLESWGKGGGGSYSRSLYRFTGRDYELIRTDGFTEFDFNAKDKTRTATMPHDDAILYFVETRLPEKKN